nr:hypothetical protein [Tanacetum cinerariifolium]
MNRHTKDQCFKIISYPDWWIDPHKTASNKGAKKDKPSTSPTTNTRNTTKNSNDRRSEGGFGGVAAAVGEEREESFLVKGKGERGLNSKFPISFHQQQYLNSTTSTEALNINATPEHPVPDMISEVSSSQPNNLDNPQPDNLDENNAEDIQDSTSEILQEHEEEVPRKYVLPPRSNRGVPPKRYSPKKPPGEPNIRWLT